jgi:alpha-tubulin suppressor-like RCC1 family protein
MKSKILLLLLILTFITCRNKPTENIIDEKFCDEQLEIIIDESRITIDNESNVGSVETEKIINKKPYRKQPKPTESALFSNAYKLITLKEFTIHTKTCNAGQNFILRLVCNNKALEFHQPSVVSWSRISKETAEIYSILKDKTDLKE